MWPKWTVLCCLLACSLVSAKTAEKNGLVPTEAPLMRSTVKPTMAPIEVAQPTKSMIINVPPKTSSDEKGPIQTTDSMPAVKAKPVDAPAAVVKDESLATGLRVSDGKPVQVTGFITKSGNIYEIQDKDGIGMIEGRQSPANENMNVCNYGSVVIYSDVPCAEVTNIRVGDVVQTTLKDEKDQSSASSPNAQEVSHNNNGHKDDDNSGDNVSLDQELDDLDEDEFDKPAPVRRPNPNRRRVQQNQNKRRRRNKNRKSSSVNSSQVNRRRTQAQKNRKRKNQQQNRRRRVQNQNQQQQTALRRQQNSENRIRPNHRRRTRKGNGSNGNGSNGSRRRNTNRNGNGNRRRWNQRRQSQPKRRQHETTNSRRHFDEDDY